MGRRKKEEKNKKQGSFEEAKKPRFSIAGDAKRSVVAVFLFALALVILLGFFEKAGVVGGWLDKITGNLVGWAKLITPLFLIVAGIVLLMRKETAFYVTKIVGLVITLASLTAFFHWFYDIDQMGKMAKAGSGGGYIGYGVAYASVKLLGNAGGLVVIFALFLIGIIVAFNFSIFHFFEKLFQRAEVAAEEAPVEKTDALEFAGAMPVENKDALPENKIKPEPDLEQDQKVNIGKVEFVDGPDEYVDEKLATGITRSEFSVKSGKKKSLGEKKFVPLSGNAKWQFPPLDLLEESSGEAKGGDIEKNAEIIEKTLRNFGIEVERGEIKVGPSVTQYSFRPAVGVKISRILSLQNDLALALAAHPIRIEAPIPGKALIGIEVPNKVSATVRLREVIESEDFKFRKSNLTVALGEDVSGSYVFGNLDKMPHLMIAGATGTGKSVGINSIITTLLYQNSPEDLKFIMVDPKRVELSQYKGIPHLLSEVIVENGKVVSALRWAVGEMERRYRTLQDSGSKDITSYNEKRASGQNKKYTDPETGEVKEEALEKLPFIVIIIDELADLMGSHGKEVEGAVVRIAQMARAVGIHLIVSTQRPSVEVITGLIKANITTRVAFQVATQIDSRTILDMAGAEKLLGNGDMLYLSASSPKPKRVQGIFISESEVRRVVKFINGQKDKVEEKIGEDITSPSQGGTLEFQDSHNGGDSQDDELYEAAKEEVIRAGKGSASLLQRRLRVGYSRAARLLDILEEKGIIGPADGAKPREVYAAKDTPQEAINYDSAIEDQTVRDKWQM